MKEITEQEAQELANEWGVFLSVDKNGEVWWSDSEPETNGKDKWANSNSDSSCGELPIRILSEKIWSDQLFIPSISGKSVTKETVEMQHDKKHYRFMEVQSDSHTVNGYCQSCARVVEWKRHLTTVVPDIERCLVHGL